ncbi:Protein HIRA-like [Papilio machaon]|uniref:Protein HIRA n=1 Tax=Papilio machaon TaxID=76193 RepID=A0A194RNU5_PAPMA|nr:Protein HIRA-like [Papilio machaon]
MKLLKPSWVNHDDKPIFSVDIHPTGKRFATGGQGGDSGRVVVWNLNSVLFEAVEVDPNVPKMLCQMDNHLACVNCVRWSNGGRYLASGGDDRLIMVWGLSVAPSAPGKHKAETWRCLATLRGHAGDVLDLAWSPLDKWLASCSVDNTIIIWNAEKFPEMVCVLNGHKGLVKGVAWDPVTALRCPTKSLSQRQPSRSTTCAVGPPPFIACADSTYCPSGDHDSRNTCVVPDQNLDGSCTTHVLRLSWSPDGQYVLSAHAMNGGGPTAQVVERDGWRCDKDFVGHRKAVTCARFNNNIFVKEGKKCCCAAVGSRDRALSIWLTSLKRPLVVVHDLFTDSVGKYLASQSDDKSLRVWKTADWAQETVITEPFEECGGTTHVLRLSWSPDGQYVLSAHAMNGGGPTAQVVERDGWRCDKDFVGHRKAVTCAVSLNLLACSSDGTVACIQFTNKEIGTPLTLDEKNAFYEKIYGKCLVNESGGDLTSNLLVECPEILLAREKQDAKKETAKEDVTPKSDKSQSVPAVTSPAGSTGCSMGALASTPVRPMDRQIETRTSDGKRRITPVFIPLTNVDAKLVLAPPTSSCAPGTFLRVTVGGVMIALRLLNCETLMYSCESLGSQPGGGEHCFSTSSQSKSRIRVERRDDIVIHPNVSNHATSHNNTSNNNDNSVGSGLDQRLRKRGGGPLPGPRAEELAARAGGGTSGGGEGPARVSLPAPVLGAAGPVVRAAGALRLQVVNKACNTQYGTLSRLQLIPNNSASNDPVWETYLALMSQASKMTLSGDTLLLVTTAAELAIWDLDTAECVIRPLCFRSLLSHGVCMYCMCRVVWSEAGDPVRRAGGGARSVLAAQRPRRPPPPHAAYTPTPHSLRPHAPSSSYAAGAARSWLEAQLAACLHLRLAPDYRYWLSSLFTHLLSYGNEEQLRGILDDLLGPSHCTSVPKKWQSNVLGIKKHDLLEEMLSLLVKQLRWQRLYTEYSEQLRHVRAAPALNGH